MIVFDPLICFSTTQNTKGLCCVVLNGPGSFGVYFFYCFCVATVVRVEMIEILKNAF